MPYTIDEPIVKGDTLNVETSFFDTATNFPILPESIDITLTDGKNKVIKKESLLPQTEVIISLYGDDTALPDKEDNFRLCLVEARYVDDRDQVIKSLIDFFIFYIHNF